MLILARTIGEVIHIGPTVKIRVLGVSGNQVRFGVEAPRDVAVFRDELLSIPAVAKQLADGRAIVAEVEGA